MKPFIMFKVVNEGATIHPDGRTVYMQQPEIGSIDRIGDEETAPIDYEMLRSHVNDQLNEIVKYIEYLEEGNGAQNCTSSCNIYRFKNNCKTLGAYYQRNKKLIRPDLEN